MTEKKIVKKHINHILRGILFYSILTIFIVMADAVIRTVGLMMYYPDGAQMNAAVDALLEDIASHGSSSIVAVLLGTAFLFVYFRKDTLFQPMFAVRQKPSLRILVMLVCFMMATQFIFSFMAEAAEAGANLLGYSFMSAIEAATETSETVSMFLYAALVGPIVEEIIYRGFVMNSLQRYGKTFAIVVSAAIFGIMHGNLLQGIFAFMAGIVFGYAAMEYSIYLSMILHVINNCLFGDIFVWLTVDLSEKGRDMLYMAVIGGFFVAACVLAYRNRKKIVSYFSSNQGHKKYYRYAFTALWMVLFILLEGFLMLEGIEKIS